MDPIKALNYQVQINETFVKYDRLDQALELYDKLLKAKTVVDDHGDELNTVLRLYARIPTGYVMLHQAFLGSSS